MRAWCLLRPARSPGNSNLLEPTRTYSDLPCRPNSRRGDNQVKTPQRQKTPPESAGGRLPGSRERRRLFGVATLSVLQGADDAQHGVRTEHDRVLFCVKRRSRDITKEVRGLVTPATKERQHVFTPPLMPRLHLLPNAHNEFCLGMDSQLLVDRVDMAFHRSDREV